MQCDTNPTTRTQWAERHVEDFLALPLVREFVLRSPQTIDGVQKEVTDHLIMHGGRGILVSQKCQEDPMARAEAKTEFWARKNAKGAVRQLIGALRAKPRLIWCDHPRRGRIEFPAGLPPITHGIVLTEVFRPVDLQRDADDLPLSYRRTPITYLSVNDFLNLAVELRTMPELMAYLDARRGLPIPDLKRIGSERALFLSGAGSPIPASTTAVGVLVIDTSVLVAGIAGFKSWRAVENPSASFLRDWIEHATLTWLVSDDIFSEYKEVLTRLGVRRNLVGEVINLLREEAEFVDVRISSDASPDPDDNPFCACAEQGRATFIATLK